jgi:hypothetical protein
LVATLTVSSGSITATPACFSAERPQLTLLPGMASVTTFGTGGKRVTTAGLVPITLDIDNPTSNLFSSQTVYTFTPFAEYGMEINVGGSLWDIVFSYYAKFYTGDATQNQPGNFPSPLYVSRNNPACSVQIEFDASPAVVPAEP